MVVEVVVVVVVAVVLVVVVVVVVVVVTLGPTLHFSCALLLPIVTLLICTIWMSKTILEDIFQGGEWSALVKLMECALE